MMSSIHTDAQLTGKIIDQNNSVTFCEFLVEIDASVPSDRKIIIILDNGSSHVSKATRQWLADHPRFEAHYTPEHAWWVNQIELFFRFCNANSSATVISLTGQTSTMDYFSSSKGTTRLPRSFAWTYSGQPLKAA